MHEDKIEYLVGDSHVEVVAQALFSDVVGEFLNDLSNELRHDDAAKAYLDIQAFAFWIRKANYAQLKGQVDTKQCRIGRGLVFHITPSNVPINFAYSLVFGMVSGNANIVRVSSKPFAQVDIVCDCINRLLSAKHKALQHQLSIIRYQPNKSITDYYSKVCHARIIWGGDATIQEIRQSPINPRAVELNFADRFSFAIISPEAIMNLDAEELKKLALKFYNDTYLMDQNACTAPHVVFWKKSNQISMQAACTRFWQAIYDVARDKYNLEGIKACDKYTELHLFLAKHTAVNSVKKYENYLYVVSLDNISGDLEQYKGQFGLFYEYSIESLEEIASLINEKVQTCSVFGMDKQDVIDMVREKHLLGIDRVVEIGQTLDMSLVWDGYDIVSTLSRIIN